jgi:hypothetical protein
MDGPFCFLLEGSLGTNIVAIAAHWGSVGSSNERPLWAATRHAKLLLKISCFEGYLTAYPVTSVSGRSVP